MIFSGQKRQKNADPAAENTENEYQGFSVFAASGDIDKDRDKRKKRNQKKIYDCNKNEGGVRGRILLTKKCFQVCR